jgi:hypothetical protein
MLIDCCFDLLSSYDLVRFFSLKNKIKNNPSKGFTKNDAEIDSEKTMAIL